MTQLFSDIVQSGITSDLTPVKYGVFKFSKSPALLLCLTFRQIKIRSLCWKDKSMESHIRREKKKESNQSIRYRRISSIYQYNIHVINIIKNKKSSFFSFKLFVDYSYSYTTQTWFQTNCQTCSFFISVFLSVCFFFFSSSLSIWWPTIGTAIQENFKCCKMWLK